MKTLVIVPCGKAKIWNKNLDHKLVKAEDAYTGTFFKINKEFASTFGDNWIILSAKYGFIFPQIMIENYDISFNDKRTNPVSTERLKEQIKIQKLFLNDKIIGLGGKEYRKKFQKLLMIITLKSYFLLRIVQELWICRCR